MMNIVCLKSFLLTLHMALGQDVANTQAITATTDLGKIYACPRCRRAKPPGPRKRSNTNKQKEKNDDQ